MEHTPVTLRILVKSSACSHVDLTSDDRLNTGLLARLIEINNSEHDTVIRNSQRIHSQAFDVFGRFADPGHSVQQTVFRVNV